MTWFCDTAILCLHIIISLKSYKIFSFNMKYVIQIFMYFSTYKIRAPLLVTSKIACAMHVKSNMHFSNIDPRSMVGTIIIHGQFNCSNTIQHSDYKKRRKNLIWIHVYLSDKTNSCNRNNSVDYLIQQKNYYMISKKRIAQTEQLSQRKLNRQLIHYLLICQVSLTVF